MFQTIGVCGTGNMGRAIVKGLERFDIISC